MQKWSRGGQGSEGYRFESYRGHRLNIRVYYSMDLNQLQKAYIYLEVTPYPAGISRNHLSVFYFIFGSVFYRVGELNF